MRHIMRAVVTTSQQEKQVQKNENKIKPDLIHIMFQNNLKGYLSLQHRESNSWLALPVSTPV